MVNLPPPIPPPMTALFDLAQRFEKADLRLRLLGIEEHHRTALRHLAVERGAVTVDSSTEVFEAFVRAVERGQSPESILKE